jgi:hypothetical protein
VKTYTIFTPCCNEAVEVSHTHGDRLVHCSCKRRWVVEARDSRDIRFKIRSAPPTVETG